MSHSARFRHIGIEKKKILLGVRNPPTTINGTLSTVLYILRSLESEESVEETEGRP